MIAVPDSASRRHDDDRLVRTTCSAHEITVDVLQIHLPTWHQVRTRLTDRQITATASITLCRMKDD